MEQNENPIDENIDQIQFVFIRNKTGKISIQTSKCKFVMQTSIKDLFSSSILLPGWQRRHREVSEGEILGETNEKTSFKKIRLPHAK